MAFDMGKSSLVVILSVALMHCVAAANPERSNSSIESYTQSERLESPSMTSLVTCFACVNCKTVDASTNKKACPWSPNTSKQKSCVSYVEKYKNSEEVQSRGCASEKGNCAEIKSAHDPYPDLIKLVSCKECQGDLCNSSGKFIPSIFLACVTLVLMPLLKSTIMT